MNKLNILCTIGTRPEVIKMAPVILKLREQSWAQVTVLATAQHRELLDQMLEVFGIVPDIDLNIMKNNQNLAELTSSLIERVSDLLRNFKPDLVLAQGDTTTVMATALCCFYEKIPFGHIEAGLRSRDLYNPYPEELNRIIADRVATFNFAPTELAKDNLLKEGVSEETIFVTGNTVIDALMMISKKDITLPDRLESLLGEKKLILITLHRRESFGEPLKEICSAINELAKIRKDVVFCYPVHPNPNVRDTVFSILKNMENVVLSEPVDYMRFVKLMQKSYLILTDSGGVQEEAPALGKPVIVLRDKTERPEVIQQGLAKLVGRDRKKIVEEVLKLLDDKKEYLTMAKGYSPYGDGRASDRIVGIIYNWWQK